MERTKPLSPCPYCGGRAMYIHHVYLVSIDSYRVFCGGEWAKCAKHPSVRGVSKKDSIEQWEKLCRDTKCPT